MTSFYRFLDACTKLRESIPGQVDKKFRVPEALKEEIGVWNSQGGGKDKLLFVSPTFLSLSHIKFFFFISPQLMITQQTTQFKLYTKDYITMYPA